MGRQLHYGQPSLAPVTGLIDLVPTNWAASTVSNPSESVRGPRLRRLLTRRKGGARAGAAAENSGPLRRHPGLDAEARSAGYAAKKKKTGGAAMPCAADAEQLSSPGISRRRSAPPGAPGVGRDTEGTVVPLCIGVAGTTRHQAGAFFVRVQLGWEAALVLARSVGMCHRSGPHGSTRQKTALPTAGRSIGGGSVRAGVECICAMFARRQLFERCRTPWLLRGWGQSVDQGRTLSPMRQAVQKGVLWHGNFTDFDSLPSRLVLDRGHTNNLKAQGAGGAGASRRHRHGGRQSHQRG